MPQTQKSSVILNILIISGLIATLLYLFHPGVDQFEVIINGEPVADSLIRFVALPTILISLIFSVLLIMLVFIGMGMFAFIGMGMLVFIGAIGFAMLGMFFLAPYFGSVLFIILFVMLVISLSNSK